MKTYILDASVAVKWFLEEEDQDDAVRLADQFEGNKIKLVVPDFFFVEMANVFWSKIASNLLRVSEGVAMMDKLMRLGLKRYSDHELSDVALENALHFGISAYDATYVSLAEIYAAPLVTADLDLIKACRRRRFHWIAPLQDLSPSK